MSLSLGDNLCSRCGWPVGKGYVIEHGDKDDDSLSYEFICRKCAAQDDKLKHLVNPKEEKKMKTKERIDEDRLNAFETLITWFAILGFGGVVYLLARVAMTAFAAVRDYLALIVFPAVMFAASAVALGTCLKWWIVG